MKGRWKGSNSKGRGNSNEKTSNFKDASISTAETMRKEKHKKDRSKVICYRCDKPRHFVSQFPDRIQKLQESNFNEIKDNDKTVFLHETVFLNKEKVVLSRYYSQENDVWYLEKWVGDHMTGNRPFFSELGEGIIDRVMSGDNSCVRKKGKGAILFQGKRGKSD